MKTIVLFQTLSENHLQRIKQIAPNWKLINGDDKEVWLPHLQEAEIICGWKPEIEELCLGADTDLRWVQAWGAGVEKLPLTELERRGVVITTASGVHPNPTSETAFAMMLSFSRGLHISIRNQMLRKWQVSGSLGEIHGRTIGIIGVGAIGTEVARLAKAFGMHVLGVRRTGKPTEYVDQMYDMQGLHKVLAESDYVVSTTPLTDQTRDMFSYEQFRMMKRTAYYINIGRGATTNTEALIEALQSGEIAGAGLDVFEQEPLMGHNPLWGMENVIITPHIGGITNEYQERAIEIFLTNLDSYIRGQEPSLNKVDLNLQY